MNLLELTPLELLFFNDNRSSRPANFIIQLDLDGVADEQLLERSFSLTCSRHPLVSSTVVRGPRRRWYWSKSEQEPKIDWVDSIERIDLKGKEKIDLRHQVGLRVWVSRTENSTAVLMEFNHSCTDGIGAYRFIGDWLSIYDSLYSGSPWDDNLPEIDPDRLETRFTRLENEVRKRGWLSRFAIALREGIRYVGPPINRLHPKKQANSADDAVFPGLVSHNFSEAEHRELKKAAVESGFSVNDLLITELFLTLVEWNQQNPCWSWNWRRRIRLSLPTDMRDQSDYTTSASNLTALVFLTRHLSDLKDSEKLRSSIREEILKIRSSRKGVDNLITLDMLSNLPFPALWLSTRAICCYTSVISNIGDPTRRMLNRFEKKQRKLVAGNLNLNLITGVPPMRPDTNLAVSIFSYRRFLTISFRCDPRLFRKEDTSELLSIYTRRLLEYTK